MTTPEPAAHSNAAQPGGASAGPVPASEVSVDLAFGEADLFRLRAEVTAHAGVVAEEDLVHRVLIVSSELATNAIRHGGGSGRLRLWSTDHALVCQVIDKGAGITDPHAGEVRPDPLSRGGRGIWFCRQLADEFDVVTGSSGTIATATFQLSADGSKA